MICGHCHAHKAPTSRDMHRHWGRCRADGRWGNVAELRRTGRHDEADRLVRRILGIQGPPMTEEKKAELKAWSEAHKDEIREKRRMKVLTRRRTLELLAAGTRRR